jgi:hypothetical protein
MPLTIETQEVNMRNLSSSNRVTDTEAENILNTAYCESEVTETKCTSSLEVFTQSQYFGWKTDVKRHIEYLDVDRMVRLKLNFEEQDVEG